MRHVIEFVVILVALTLASWSVVWLNAMLIAGEPIRQTIVINWHAMILRHRQWPDQTPPPCELTCSCGRTWEVSR